MASSSSNPSSWQTMPERMKKSIEEHEGEIKKLKTSNEQLRGIIEYCKDEVRNMEQKMKDLEKGIRTENDRRRKIGKRIECNEMEITEKQIWVDKCKRLNP